LAEKGDELLVELLASTVESKTGVRPDNDEVAEFLAALGKPVIAELVHDSASRPKRLAAQRPAPQTAARESSRSGRLILRGKAHSYNNAKDAMVIVLRELAKADATFLERCYLHPDAQGRKRRYIARTPEELYPDREDLREMREPLPGGWLVATNLNNILKKTIIRVAAEVAGLDFGKDVIVEFYPLPGWRETSLRDVCERFGVQDRVATDSAFLSVGFSTQHKSTVNQQQIDRGYPAFPTGWRRPSDPRF
jgi:hypothetical protein